MWEAKDASLSENPARFTTAIPVEIIARDFAYCTAPLHYPITQFKQM